jgi:hypothetical protein
VAPLSPLGYTILSLINRVVLNTIITNTIGLTSNQDQDLDFHGFNNNNNSREDLGKE